MQIAIEYEHPYRDVKKDSVIVRDLDEARKWLRANSDAYGGDLMYVVIYEIGVGFDPYAVYNLPERH